MIYFQATTDASYFYQPSSAADSSELNNAAVAGNLSDYMRNATIYRGTFMAPPVVQVPSLLQAPIPGIPRALDPVLAPIL